jgi:hypothetical protein
MAWLEIAGSAITVADLGVKLAKSSGVLRRNTQRIIYAVTKGNVYIPIFGCGGAGKTTAAKILGGTDPLELSAPYEESWRVEPVKLTGDVPGQILAAPGQIDKTERHWPELYKNVITKRNVGIINVVSYGYHSLKISKYEEHKAFKAGMKENDFLEKYIEERRDLEISFLNTLLDSISASSGPLWMITLVNKQDLWRDDGEDVKNHYTQGAYNDRIEKFRNSIGKNNFQHDYVAASLTISNLGTDSGQILAKSTAGYGIPDHLSGINLFISRVSEMIE